MSIAFNFVDKRHYKTIDIIEGYKLWSTNYDSLMSQNMDIFLLEHLKNVPWTAIHTLADLGCGTGRIGQWLRIKNSLLILDGIDISTHMLEIASTKNVYQKLTQDNILHLPHLISCYDSLCCSLVACHIQSIDELFEQASTMVKDGGYFILLDFHPFFLLNGIPTHFDLPDGTSIAIENWIHFFSDHFRAAQSNGFNLIEFNERIVDPTWVVGSSPMAKYLYQPASFVMVWKKQLIISR